MAEPERRRRIERKGEKSIPGLLRRRRVSRGKWDQAVKPSVSKRPNVTAMAVPRTSDVAALAQSLVRGRLPSGSLLGQVVSALNPTRALLRDSKAGSILRGEPNLIRGATAATNDSLDRALDQYNRERVVAGKRAFDYPLRRGLVPSTPKKMAGQARAGTKGTFVPTARLDPTQVIDRRGIKSPRGRYTGPVQPKVMPPDRDPREGASSSSRGPSPNPMARRRANSHARFKRV